MKPITLALLLALSFVPAQFAAGLDDAARLLPADATALIGINVASAKNSVLYSRFEQHMDADDPDKLDDFALQTGLDPRTDLDRLTVAMWGPRAEESLLIVAQGRARVTPGAQAFVDMVSQAGSHHGIPIYEGRERTDSRPMHFSFLDEATLIAGTPGAVIDGIERHVAGGPSAFDNDTLMGLASIAEADGQLWMVSRQAGDFLSRAPALPGARDPRLLRILSAMEETTFSLNIVDGLNFVLAGVCGSAADAQTLATAVRGMMAIAQLGAGPEGGMLSMLDQIRVTDQDNTVEAALDLTASELDDWIRVFESTIRQPAD